MKRFQLKTTLLLMLPALALLLLALHFPRPKERFRYETNRLEKANAPGKDGAWGLRHGKTLRWNIRVEEVAPLGHRYFPWIAWNKAQIRNELIRVTDAKNRRVDIHSFEENSSNHYFDEKYLDKRDGPFHCQLQLRGMNGEILGYTPKVEVDLREVETLKK